MQFLSKRHFAGLKMHECYTYSCMIFVAYHLIHVKRDEHMRSCARMLGCAFPIDRESSRVRVGLKANFVFDAEKWQRREEHDP